MRTLPSLALILMCASPVAAEELKVYAAAAVKTPLLEMAKEYEAATGNTVVCVFDTAGATEQKFRADPGAALLITTETLINDRVQSGTLNGGVSARLGATVAGLAVPPGAAKPDISTPAALRAALLSAPRIAFSDPSRGATVG